MKRIIKAGAICLVVILGGVHGFCQKGKSELTVRITGLKNPTGQVLVALFDNEKDFLKREVQHKKVQAKMGEVSVTFRDLSPGRYAVSVIHDENKNEKLDTNLVGIPKEMFGFSNNAKINFGPPSFKNASFALESNSMEIDIQLISLF
jgi:uncharacterized protein (DUF2141 family)